MSAAECRQVLLSVVWISIILYKHVVAFEQVSAAEAVS